MTARVSGSWNSDQVFIKSSRIAPAKHALDGRKRTSDVVTMNDPLSAKTARPLFVICHVIAMSEEHSANSAQLINSLDQRARKSRRVNEDVPFRSNDQIARGSVRRL